ncbi:DUF2273 domain-containing protein [Nesterenkonia sp. LB17]|uniref:DUF2273 domain-containing protein n=1 Tax=unclassified Nesterenkonia TaxID=2629769 RepID=UPI001F4C5E55|nr:MULTISPECIES: DUF2273 domain-containing protein [unclassified Nesterenkonia]MCH8560628.1 DUF2273 domain-containing protein [Nesterenkonia sp. DZ6]MCH8562906.1 DUF2273 domain-containing protein [Nesterenkonia sp. YGD6]MCH8565944.1 DUF2273 domain-containing protein [Nesterenkonia sp. LB17]MCH8570736.1 DUF2273 domain-containing protein [Nesterenkonia sp. AY15]
MSATVSGAAIGAVLALTLLVFGFWGLLLVAVATVIGAMLGRIVEGRLDLAGVMDALRGQRSS